MTPYLFLLFVILAVAVSAGQSPNRPTRRLALVGIGVILVIFAGIRSSTVGTDSGTYVTIYGMITSGHSIWQSTEVGYNALMSLCASISDKYMILFFGIALISVTNYLVTIARMVDRFYIAIFVFVAFGSYTFFFNGARQGIAASICFLALPWLLRRRPVPYFLTVVLAALFHHSAVVMLPVYFLAFPRQDWRIYLIVGIVTVGISLFLSSLVEMATQLVSEKYANHDQATEATGRVTCLFLITQGVFFSFFKKNIGEHRIAYTRLLNIYVLSLIPAIVTLVTGADPSGILRFHIYFSQTAILLWPIVLGSISDRRMFILLMYLFIGFGIAFFAMSISSFSNLIPYATNPDTLWQ